MLSVSSTASTALAVLKQSGMPLASSGSVARGDGQLTLANGVAVSATLGASNSARAKAVESLFDMKTPDINEMKVRLIERLGDEFGLDVKDFESQMAFARAIKGAVTEIRREVGGEAILREIEKNLGLDELGISLDTLINALADPSSSDAEKLDAALKKHLVESGQGDAEKGADPNLARLRFDEIGRYGI